MEVIEEVGEVGKKRHKNNCDFVFKGISRKKLDKLSNLNEENPPLGRYSPKFDVVEIRMSRGLSNFQKSPKREVCPTPKEAPSPRKKKHASKSPKGSMNFS